MDCRRSVQNSTTTDKLCLMTVTDREALYTKKEVHKVLKAGDFLKALGYPTEAEGLRIVSNGSVLNVPHSTVDVKRFFDICMGRRSPVSEERPRDATLWCTGWRTQPPRCRSLINKSLLMSFMLLGKSFYSASAALKSCY